jgi:hypothetical protein
MSNGRSSEPYELLEGAAVCVAAGGGIVGAGIGVTWTLPNSAATSPIASRTTTPMTAHLIDRLGSVGVA